MAEKIIKTLRRFQGVNYGMNYFYPDERYLHEGINIQFGEDGALRKRKAFHMIGQAGGFIGSSTYRYSDPTTGATTEKLIAINDRLWVLNRQTLTVTRTSTTSWGIHVYWRYQASGLNSYYLRITEGGTPITIHGVFGNYMPLNTGMEHVWGSSGPDGLITMFDVQQTLDALANYTCAAINKTGKVNGAQTGVSSVTVDAGHTIDAFEEISFWDYSSKKLVAKRPVTTTATSFDFTNTAGTNYANVNVENDQIIGLGAVPAASMEETTTEGTYTETTADSKTLYFWAWEPVPVGGDLLGSFQLEAPLSSAFASRNTTSYLNPSFTNAGESIHVFTRGITSLTNLAHENYPYKYDSKCFYRSGVPAFRTAPTIAASGAGITGTYKYSCRFVYKDAQGIIHKGIPSHVYSESSIILANQTADLTMYGVRTNIDANTKLIVVNGNQVGVTTITFTAKATAQPQVNGILYFIDRSTGLWTYRTVTATTSTTVTISGAIVDVDAGDNLYNDMNFGFDDRGVTVNLGQNDRGPVTALDTNWDETGMFSVGDVIYFYDNKRFVYTERTISAISTTGQLSWTGDDANFNDDERISGGMRIEIYRTKAGGTKYYYVATIPNPTVGTDVAPSAALQYAQIVYHDKLPDTNLGPELDFDIDRAPDLPPKAAFGTVHQETLVLSGILDNPNTVAFSDQEEPEAFPAATNSFDIASTLPGGVTGVISDTDNNLAVFKKNGYYDVTGDLTQFAFEVRNVREGDFGISSHNSLAKIEGVVVGVGRLGIIAVSQGQVNRDFGGGIAPLYIGPLTPPLELETAIGINAYDEMHYFLTHSGIDITSASYTKATFIFDYSNDDVKGWFKWNMFNTTGSYYNVDMNKIVAASMYEDRLCFLTKNPYSSDLGGWAFRRKNLNLVGSDLGRPDYMEQTEYISVQIDFPTLTEGQPDIDKHFHNIKIVSSISPYEQFTYNTPSVFAYKNFQTSSVNTGPMTYDFTASSIKEVIGPAKLSKARGFMVRLAEGVSNSVTGSCPHITALVVEISLPHKPSDFSREKII